MRATDAAQLITLMVESVFYGIYLITFFFCLRRLLWDPRANWKGLRNINIAMVSLVLLLFASSSINLALALIRPMQLFVYRSGTDANKRYDQPGDNWVNRGKSLTIFLQSIVADSVLIYRCWLIWNRSLLVVLAPLICWFGCIAFSICVLSFQVMLQEGRAVNMWTFTGVGGAFWGCTILLNVMSSSMILWKIWSIQRAWTPPSICSARDIPQRNRLQFAWRIMIESGLIYTTMTIIVFISFFYQASAIYIASGAGIQVTGIAFNLILVRAAAPYQDRMESIHMYPRADFVSSERMESRSIADVAVMTNDDC